MTIIAASATSSLSLSSFPYCFDEITGLIARFNEETVTGDGREEVESSASKVSIKKCTIYSRCTYGPVQLELLCTQVRILV